MNSVDVIRIVDDDPSITDALSFLLEGEGWNTIAYHDADTFLANDDLKVPGCLILDVRMPNSMSGLELQEQLMSIASYLPIIFISAHGDIEMAVHTIKNGACDFLPKPVDQDKLLASIEKAVQLCHRNLQASQEARARNENLKTLTPRELEVAKLLATGAPNKVVADQLGMTTRTAQVHRGAIYLKLGVHSAVEIAELVRTMN